MQFDPVITISDIVNILISLCTIITIIFTYLTLREMKKQRNLSIMPNITLDFLESLKFKFTNFNKQRLKLNFIIKNIGNGVAKNVDIKINIDDLLKYESDSIKINKKSIYLKFKKYASITMIANSNRFFYQGIQTNNKIDIQSVTLEQLLLGLSIEMFEKYNKDTSNEILMELIKKYTLTFDIVINYTDLADNNYKKFFKLEISPNHIDFGNKELNYSIKIISYK